MSLGIASILLQALQHCTHREYEV